MKRRTELKVETHQVLIIHRPRGGVSGWCPGCGAQVEMITAAACAAVCGLSLRAICRGVERGQFHFSETADGQLWICLHSLLEAGG